MVKREVLVDKIQDQLLEIHVGYTTVLYGQAVTRWDEDVWEVSTYLCGPHRGLSEAAETIADVWLARFITNRDET